MSTASTHPRRIRTIVADDSPEFLRSFCSFLEAQEQIEVVGRAANGQEAVRLAEKLRPDLAILDLEMPELDGNHAAEAMREQNPALRTIIVSVHDGPVWQEICRRAGVDAFIPKYEVTTKLLPQITAMFGTVELPAAPAFIGSQAGAPPERITVLLVDAAPGTAEAIIPVLTQPRIAGPTRAVFAVEHRSNVDEAMTWLAENSVDAVLVGVSAAAPESLQHLAQLRQAAPLAAIIALTDAGAAPLDVAVSAVGADEWVHRGELQLLPPALRYLVGLRRTEESLARREEDFRMLIENALDITCIMDGNFRIRYISPSTRQVLGFSPEELRGRDFPGLLHPEDAAAARQILERARQQPQQTMSAEVRFRQRAGHWLTLELTGRNLPDEAGGPRLVFNARDITTRKAAEEAQGQSEQRFRVLFENSPDAMFVEDFSGRVLDINAAACWLHGMPREQIIGRSVVEFIPPADRAQARADFTRIVSGEISKLESTSLAANGRAVPVELTSSRILYSGQPALLINARDITERRRAEELLAISERSYRGLFNTMRDAIYILDESGRFVDVNDGAEFMYGHPREVFIGQTPEFLSAPGRNDLAATAVAIQNALAGQPQHFEWWGLRQNGEIFPKEVHLQRGHYFGKQVIIAVGRDITERKQAELALRESEGRFRQITETIEEVFWLLDVQQQQLIYISPAFEKVWGVDKARRTNLAADWIATVHADDRERVAAAWAESLRTGHFDQTYRITRPDNSQRWIRSQAFPVLNEQGELYRLAGVARDITERRELEAQMRQMQKLDSLGRITASIAHDFNNMLAVIQGHSDQLLQEGELPPATVKSLGQIAEASRRAAKLTRQLLTFSRKQDMRFETLDLNTVITGLTPMLQRVVNKQTRLHTALAPQPGWVRADAGMIEQILMNLVVNARDALPQGGDLTISTALVDVDETVLRRDSQARRGPHHCLTVADTGSGIPPEILPRIFEPFFTTKPNNSGTGLGLSTVYGIVKQHNGWIEVETAPGHGAKFKIFLPVTAASATAAPPVPIAAPAPPATGATPATILVVEDELPLLQLHKLNWTKRGYNVLTAESGPRALDLLAENPAPIDLLITDMGLPGGMSGHALAEKILARQPGLQIIITSGFNETTENPAPNIRYLPKPFDFKQLGQLVATALAKRSA